MLKKRVKKIIIVIICFSIFSLAFRYYVEHIYLPSLNLSYHYQEGSVLFAKKDDESIQLADNDNEPDFSIDIYSNGFYKKTYYKKGTQKAYYTKISKLSNKKINQIQELLSEIEFENMSDFIFNGYLDGRGYEFTTYENNSIKKSVSGFNLNHKKLEDFDSLQQENYKDSIIEEINFVKIKDFLSIL